MPLLLAAVFMASGAAALVYEVAWVRMLAATLGASSYTIGTALAAYMAGLAIGARWIGARADRDARPLRTYAKLELGIAAAAALVPLAFLAMPALNRAAYGALEGHLWALTAVRCALAFAVLLVPTALMGATFPAMASAAAAEGHRGWRVGLVYGANTLGAVGGVLAAGFWLIGTYGLRMTTWIAVGVNVAAALAALALAARQKPLVLVPEAGVPGVSEDEAPAPERRLALAAAATCGFVSLGFEVLWTRMFAVLFASITYSFAMMLAVFLLGLALGAPLAGRISDAVKRARLEFAGALQLLVAVAALAAYMVFPYLKTQTGTTSLAFGGPSWMVYLRSLAFDAASVMLLPAFLMGCILPVAARILAQGPAQGMASRLGRVYAVNTLGAMAGSLVTGFVLIPGLRNFAHVSILLALVSALAGAALLFRGGNWAPLNRWLVTGVAAIAMALTVWAGPFRENVLLAKAGLAKPGITRLWYEEGPSLTVAVTEEEGTRDRTMWTDAFKVAGTGDTYEYMRMIAHLPMLLNPDAKSACVVGLGTGTTAGALALWPLESLDIVELCPEVSRATPYFKRANRGLMDRVGRDPRLRLVFDDGKAYLRSTRRSYDVVVAEPLNPHMSGASALYSREFYEAARGRLKPGGVVTQWIPIHGVKPEDFRSLFRTFTTVFPETVVWYFKEAVLLTGHEGKFVLKYAQFKAALDRPQTQAELIPLGLEEVYTLLGCFVAGPRASSNYARYAPVITDDLPTIEYFKPGQPVAFAERENLDGLAQHREQILPYVTFEGTTKWQSNYFTIVATNHFVARGLFVEARKLEMDAERARAAGDMRAAQSLYAQALDKLKAAANAAPEDRYVKRHMLRYEKSLKPDDKLTPEKAAEILKWSKGTVEEKVRACALMEHYADWQGTSVVIPLLTDPDPQVRYAAVKALGPMGYNEATTRRDKPESDIAELLRQQLERSRETKEVLLQAIESLKLIGPKGASGLLTVFPLKKQAGCDDAEVRAAAVVALRDIGSVEALGYLFLVLDDTDKGVRGEAVVSLANSGYPWVVPALLEALKDPFPPIAKAAAEGMRQITKLGKEWSESATAEVRGRCALEWEQWYDAWRRQRDWATRCGAMSVSELEATIDALILQRSEVEQTAWEKLSAHFATFRDTQATPEPTVEALSRPADGFLKAVVDNPKLWMAAVVLEQKSGLMRGIIPPDRMQSLK
ncbi:MAG: fused MFS/spermidine synthase [Planctomycetia bacterium]|nr:fused MFS/spermidine synthase [Planctomycetia bacterium]